MDVLKFNELILSLAPVTSNPGSVPVYDILRGGMAFIISTWAPTQHFIAWARC